MSNNHTLIYFGKNSFYFTITQAVTVLQSFCHFEVINGCDGQNSSARDLIV